MRGEIRPWTAAAKLSRRAMDLVFPPTCVSCGAPAADPGGLCVDCWRETPFIDGPVCDHCGAPLSDGGPVDVARWCGECVGRSASVTDGWARGRAATLYDGTARDLVLALKRADRTDAARPMARWMARAAAPLAREIDVVVPIPLHWRRRTARRYNQAAELARGVATALGAPLDLTALRRSRSTPSQDGRSVSARRRNVDGAFLVTAAGARRLAGRRALLVDDVLTTGATASACAMALRAAGAQVPHVLVFARVVRGRDDHIGASS